MMEADQAPTFADLLRRARREAGLTQEQLAERAGVSARGISDLERGLIRAPRRDSLELLMDALDLDAKVRARWRDLRKSGASQAGRTEPSPLTPARPSAPGLPHARTPLIGREVEIAAVIDLVRDDAVPLLSLTGPGGVGKTRLAVAAAGRLTDEFPDGVWYVSLAPLGTSDLVIPAVAAVFGIIEQPGRSLHQVLESALGERRMLLVLDNLEHVIDAAVDIGNVLAGCRNLTILATSRVPLRIYGEREYPVLPLDLPAEHAQLSPQQFAGIEAIELFVERAKAIHPSFRLTAGTAQDVAAICRKLDGLPLAIELAAARSRLFSPNDLLARLERPLAVLTGGPRDVPVRQRTLRNTVAWSYDLLGADEQQLFRQLGVFRGGWTLEAARAVTGPRVDVEAGLEALIEHSLVLVHETTDRRRFGMLETIREFADEQLETSGELEETVCRHSGYFVDLV